MLQAWYRFCLKALNRMLDTLIAPALVIIALVLVALGDFFDLRK